MARSVGRSVFISLALASMLAMQLDLWHKANRWSVELLSSELSSSPMEGNMSSPLPSIEQQETAFLPPFRMLLGIFSVGNPKGIERRDLIRKTYLSFPTFLEQHNITTIPLRHARICSLYDYWHKTITQPEQCQLLYTFVLGGATDERAPVEYLTLEAGRNMTVDPSTIPNAEPDTTYLNIRENMDFGKTNTWFKYASTQLPQDDLQIDMIAKVDTDTLLYPDVLLEEMESRLKDVSLVYGGSVVDNDKGHHYMQGGFYFLSRLIAERISAGRDDRWEVVQAYMPSYRHQRPEDVETGQFVEAFGGEHIYHMDIAENKAFVHKRRLKEDKIYQQWWDQYGEQTIAKDQLSKIQTKHQTDCPSQRVLAQERDIVQIPSAAVRSRFDSLLDELITRCHN
jgi:hypothetical protein